MEDKYTLTQDKKDESRTRVTDNSSGKLVAINKNGFIGLIGMVSAQDVVNICAALGYEQHGFTFVFPGNDGHHTKDTTLFSLKSGGGVAKVAGNLGRKFQASTLSLPTTWYHGGKDESIVASAIADFQRTYGYGMPIVLPIRKKASGKYFGDHYLLDIDGEKYEPSFWGAINKNPDQVLARRFLRELMYVYDGFEPLEESGKIEFNKGKAEKEKNTEERSEWYQAPDVGKLIESISDISDLNKLESAIEKISKLKLTDEQDKQFNRLGTNAFNKLHAVEIEQNKQIDEDIQTIGNITNVDMSKLRTAILDIKSMTDEQKLQLNAVKLQAMMTIHEEEFWLRKTHLTNAKDNFKQWYLLIPIFIGIYHGIKYLAARSKATVIAYDIKEAKGKDYDKLNARIKAKLEKDPIKKDNNTKIDTLRNAYAKKNNDDPTLKKLPHRYRVFTHQYKDMTKFKNDVKRDGFKVSRVI